MPLLQKLSNSRAVHRIKTTHHLIDQQCGFQMDFTLAEI